MEIEATRKRFTVDEYYKMAGVGIFTDGDRTELIDGEVIQMTSMGARHAAAVARATDLLIRTLHGRAMLRPRLPFRLNTYNEPEPDIALFRTTPDYYRSGHPGPADVLLVLEIADSSLSYDRDIKLPIYAAAGIPEVWIMDLASNTLLAYRDPDRNSYTTSLQLGGGDSIACLAFPDVEFRVDALLGT